MSDINIDVPYFEAPTVIRTNNEAARYIATVMEEEWSRSGDAGARAIAQAIFDEIGEEDEL